jgi:thymidylate synthase ThyX
MPDYILPPLIAQCDQAEVLYHQVMQETWQAIRDLREEGASLEDALYLLPNAFPIRFEESGDLMAFHHKWTTRLCYTAQEEIWANCLDEVLQVKEHFPEIGRFLHPPCTLRKMAHATPYCPEGERFCGVRVWNLEPEEFSRFL